MDELLIDFCVRFIFTLFLQIPALIYKFYKPRYIPKKNAIIFIVVHKLISTFIVVALGGEAWGGIIWIFIDYYILYKWKNVNPEIYPFTLGYRITQLRNQNNLTQQQLGEKVGLLDTEIEQIESGWREISDKQATALADALKTDVSFIMGNESVRYLSQEVSKKQLDRLSEKSNPPQNINNKDNSCNFSLSKEGEQPQTYERFYGNDMLIEKSTTEQPKKESFLVLNDETQEKHYFCSSTESSPPKISKKSLDNLTRRYKIALIVISVFLLISLIISFALFDKNLFYQEEISTLQNNTSRLETNITILEKKNDRLSDEISDTKDEINFYRKNAVLVYDDGTNLYHTRGCNFPKSNTYWIYNIELAIYKGYKRCPYCDEDVNNDREISFDEYINFRLK